MRLKGSSFIAGVVVGAVLLLLSAYSVYSFTSTVTQLYKASIESQAKLAGSYVILRITNATLNLTDMRLEVTVLNDGPESSSSILLLELVVTVSIDGYFYTYMLKHGDELDPGCWVIDAVIINDVKVAYDGIARPLRPGEGLLINAQLPLSSEVNINYGYVTLITPNSRAERTLKIVK